MRAAQAGCLVPVLLGETKPYFSERLNLTVSMSRCLNHSFVKTLKVQADAVIDAAAPFDEVRCTNADFSDLRRHDRVIS